MIQISLNDKMIVWDLNKNIEIDALENYSDFITPESFVDNGFNLSQEHLRPVQIRTQKLEQHKCDIPRI